MTDQTISTGKSATGNKSIREAAVIDRFLDAASDESFTPLYELFAPQVIAYYRARSCDSGLSEDLAQEVMLTVHRKASQIRDRALFRGWLFRIARHTLCRHYNRESHRIEMVSAENSVDHLAQVTREAGTPGFEFMHWMAFLDSRERELMALRYIEDWEYREIAKTKQMPIGTVQSRIFNAKKKLAPILTMRRRRNHQEENRPEWETRAA